MWHSEGVEDGFNELIQDGGSADDGIGIHDGLAIVWTREAMLRPHSLN